MPRSIEEILSEAKERGLRLNNLFELKTYPAHPNVPEQGTGQYQANFHHPNGWHDFGRGMTATAALEDALARVKNLKGPENYPKEPVLLNVIKPLSLEDVF